MHLALLSALLSSSATAQDYSNRPNLALNGSFEEGLAGWPWENGWYEQPQGSGKGVSRFEVDETIAHDGKRSARVRGKDNRGIILQALPVRPGPYRLSGWVRCQGLGEAAASIIIEWLAEGGKWIGAEAGSVRGDADWTFVSADVVAPDDARTAHLDCLTNQTNSGTAWFDDVRLITLAPGDGVPPPPLPLRVRPAPWTKGTIVADWPEYQAPEDLGLFRAYVSEAPLTEVSGPRPAAAVDGSARSITVRGLETGTPYYMVVLPVDVYGNAPPPGPGQRVVPGDPQAPRMTVTPLLGATGALQVSLSPPLSGARPQGYTVTVDCAGASRQLACSRSSPVALAHGLPQGTEATVTAVANGHDAGPALATVAIPAALPKAPQGAGGLGGTVTSAATGAPLAGARVLVQTGTASREVTTTTNGRFSLSLPRPKAPAAARLFASADGHLSVREDILVGDGALYLPLRLTPRSDAPWALWTASPLDQVFQDAPPPANPKRQVELLTTRNEAECCQIVVRPTAAVEGARVVFENLQSETGRHVLPSAGFSARFVSFVHVDRNSRATPPEELVRVGPADYPDELSDDEARSLPAERTQPIFLSFFTPAGTPPGVYRGHVYLATPIGLDPVPVSLEVLPLDFPDDPRLWVVNWFSTASFESRYAASPDSEEWWSMLGEYARLFRRYHQNVVTVSPDLCKIWVEADGAHTYEWARFDRWCETFLAEGVRRLNVTHLGSRKTGAWEEPEFVLYDRPATNRATGATTTVPVTEFAAELQKHLEEKGWLDLAYQHIADEPIPVNVESWKQQSARVHAAAPKLKRMDAIQVPDLRGSCELWVPQLNYFDQWYADYDQWHRAGECELWFYIAWVPQGRYPNRLIDIATIKPRLVHWMNYLYNATGYLHWGLNQWDVPFNTFSPGDEWMTWPGYSGPNSSLRYEAQRDGLEDCECLFLLEDAQREVIRRLGAEGIDPQARSMEIGRRVVRSMTDYTRSYADLQAAREELLREAVAARRSPLAVIVTEPGTAAPVKASEVAVWGFVEPGCAVMVNGERAPLDGNRFLARTRVTAETPTVTVVIRKGREEKTVVRRFSVVEE